MKKSILIIDDDEEDHMIIRDALSEACIDVLVYSAFNGPLGLALLRDLKGRLPSLIILDFNMPEMDGLEVLKKIKERYSIPVLLHTTGYTDKLREEAKSRGAVDCIKKGCSYRDIVKTAQEVEKFLKIP